MKTNATDVLLYLFRHYRHAEVTDAHNRGVLRDELTGAGFAAEAIGQTLLALMPARARPRAVRIVAPLGRPH